MKLLPTLVTALAFTTSTASAWSVKFTGFTLKEGEETQRLKARGRGYGECVNLKDSYTQKTSFLVINTETRFHKDPKKLKVYTKRGCKGKKYTYEEGFYGVHPPTRFVSYRVTD
ncbi:hypothetical protein FQN55_007807 [Onygenales sp. PD_40]|nr:hypothetical protein FQN55_007807 [Onygenales sp. PD_40]KAK2787300.1 hypothetical protein FQN53_005459 [Emmonsiellopsis sp. PD_33]KAK2792473.1 hypothetical protein FQN52_003408 [Onygenales sp. PD_12]KAK2805153.1 hypothetical protein FQN51_000676 [Onygenales sp. PD_10]